ncbi:hypothetical protein SAMN05216352_10330 [Alteribacillus bidgolensis]|uniref:Uncharacterized protein n=1 Tax=Alteribacillus bidgolensis TaxID=930129 RepID=A0A1G8FPD5_9BACI|nr:hypothetical protein SAMN05216352_10330 [Alteribacillus bidgolensis]
MPHRPWFPTEKVDVNFSYDKSDERIYRYSLKEKVPFCHVEP